MTTQRISAQARLVAFLGVLALAACGSSPPGDAQSATLGAGGSAGLAIVPAGSGSGRVTSAPPGLACSLASGAVCSADFDVGSLVTLTAAPDSGSRFAGWSDGGSSCGDALTCAVTLSAATRVTATFVRQHSLTISAGGGGGVGGTVGAGSVLDCPASSCSALLDAGTEVTLTATPTSGFAFLTWGGACSGSASTCTVTLSVDRAVSAAFSAPLTVSVSPAGYGSVVASPTGVGCGTDCQSFAVGSVVSLTATAATGYRFLGWSGACSGSSSQCNVTLSAARSVSATFDVAQASLSVELSGTGRGSLSGVAGGTSVLACTHSCSTSLPLGTSVTLTATPDDYSTFAGWGEDGSRCGTSSTCSVTLSAASRVTATFDRLSYTLTTASSGPGRVTSRPAGLDCGATCTATFDAGQVVTLTATPSAHSVFLGWSGACATGLPQCNLSIRSARTATATFAPQLYPVEIVYAGGGRGTVTATAGTLLCSGQGCVSYHEYGTNVTFTGTPDEYSTLVGWSLETCSGAACSLSVTAPQRLVLTLARKQLPVTLRIEGRGRVATSTAGTPAPLTSDLDCQGPGSCTGTLEAGRVYTFTATPAAGALFTAWTAGGCATGLSQCNLLIAQPVTVGASFGQGPAPYALGGSISGLTSSGLVLQSAGLADLSVASGATSFAFATRLATGMTYAVSVKTQPAGNTCSVSTGSGTAGTSDVTDVAVSCADVDECQTSNGGCSANATCTNTDGSRTCACNTGYSGNGVTCADVDECLSNNGGCDANATCTNTDGSRTCACNTGFSGNGVTCANVDDCSPNPCQHGGTCTDGIATYACTCAAGYRGSNCEQAVTVALTAPTSGSYINAVADSTEYAVSGTCSEPGQTVAVQVDGSSAGSATCSAGHFAATVNTTGLTAGAHTFTATLPDPGGHTIYSAAVTVTRDTAAPEVSIATPYGPLRGGASVTLFFSAGDALSGVAALRLQFAEDGATFNDLATFLPGTTSYAWTVPPVNLGTAAVRLVATDAAGNAAAATSAAFVIDSTAPALTAGAMSINGGASNTSNSYVQVSLAGADSQSNIIKFCLKSNDSSPPATGASCWMAVNAPTPGLTPAQTLTLSNYPYLLGLSGGVYTVYAWLMDAAGNLSTLSSAGAGTSARDRATILFAPGSPPVLTNVTAASSDGAAVPPAQSDLVVPAGASVYIKWTASAGAAAFASSPVTLDYTTNDLTFVSPVIASGVANTANTGCTVSPPYTGCFKWFNASPTSAYYRLRVRVTDTASMYLISGSRCRPA